MVTTASSEDAVQPPPEAKGAQGEAKRKQSDAPVRGGGGGGGGRGGGRGGGGQGKKRKNKEVFIYGNYRNYYGYRVSSTAPLPVLCCSSRKKKSTNRRYVAHAMEFCGEMIRWISRCFWDWDGLHGLGFLLVGRGGAFAKDAP
jgi:hypothetical protein